MLAGSDPLSVPGAEARIARFGFRLEGPFDPVRPAASFVDALRSRAPLGTVVKPGYTADVCVNPDEYNEMNDKSTMNKVMEYMALGKPIVQFDLTEGRVSARDASLYAKPNDAIDLAQKIAGLLKDPALRAEMGRRGRERVERELAWKHEAPKLLRAYAALGGQGAR